MTVSSRGLVRTCDKLKPVYLQHHSAYGHQTWWGGDFLEGLQTINSYDALITLSCKVTWQKKTIIYLLPQYLWRTWLDGILSWPAPTHKVTWYYISIICYKLLYLYYHKVHAHQTWKDTDKVWGAPNHKVI